MIDQQPSSLRSETDEQAEQAEADEPDQLSKAEARRQSVRRTTVAAGIPDEAPSEEKVTPTPDDVPEEPQQELIDANDVLKALKAFVVENNKHRVRQVALRAYSWELFFISLPEKHFYTTEVITSNTRNRFRYFSTFY